MTFSFDQFVIEARAAVASDKPNQAIRLLMQETLKSKEALVDNNPLEKDADEIMLFEDDTVSVWICRFDPYTVVPPHEHKMNAFIGVFKGREKNHFFKNDANGLKYQSTQIIDAGQMTSIGTDGLHAVVAEGEEDCYSLHVYTGPLSKVKRSLFDWNTGEAIEFTDENFRRLKRSPNRLVLS
jgi:predicted metal-dependent enzyme (double-stranded beta helix superfamily)|tara:strand:+ start:1675 stop:2220 length:546 start_codon:yes stop_codon:yes gene_type:complete